MTNLEFKTVRTYTTTHEAHLARGLLESEGIEAFVRDEYSVGIRPYLSQAMGGVRLDVRAECLERARSSLNIPSVEPLPPTCPKCGGAGHQAHDFGTRAATVLFSLAVMVPLLLRKAKYHCVACGDSWRK